MIPKPGAIEAQLHFLNAAVQALYWSHPDKSKLRAEFQKASDFVFEQLGGAAIPDEAIQDIKNARDALIAFLDAEIKKEAPSDS